MNNIPYLYINAIALCCYILIFCAFAASAKTAEIRYFIMLLTVLILWTGGSLLMRLRAPGAVRFWFNVSLMALYCVPVLLYFFWDRLTGSKHPKMKTGLTLLTVLHLVLAPAGIFISPPDVLFLPDGSMVFMYNVNWLIIFPVLLGLYMLYFILVLIKESISQKGIRAPGLRLLVISCCILLAGNLLQLIPGNIFPWDTLAGIVFAFLFTAALYEKRMFRLELLASRSVLIVVSVLLCFVLAVISISSVNSFIQEIFFVSYSVSLAVSAMFYACIFAVIYSLLKRYLDAVFIRDEKQAEAVTQFSHYISQILDTKDIISDLMRVISEELSVSGVCVCTRTEDGWFERKFSTDGSEDVIKISSSSPLLSCFNEERSYFILDEIRGTELYRSLPDSEKDILLRMDTACIAALKNSEETDALILIPSKKRGRKFSMTELGFIDTAAAIASIALKNAVLYERVLHEARTDSLTGVYNYKYFAEKIEEEFSQNKDRPVSLMYLDVDDFRLYNQLYGNAEGNIILVSLASIISEEANGTGSVYRHSGKVFAVILPDCDSSRAYPAAKRIQHRAALLNSRQTQKKMMTITLSIGISESPGTAKTAKELAENADLALYNARMSGKGKVSVFRPHLPKSSRIAEHVAEMIERYDSSGESSYETYSKTILALTAAIDAKDHYTYSHCQNVANYSSILASAIGLSDDQVRIVYEAALLHDIGKISISESILSKKGMLTEEEILAVREHVNSSIDIIRHLPSMDYLIPAAVSHHERWDGAGYPRGLSGEEIPVLARCLAIADAFDAMTSDRPYRRRQPAEFAVKQIRENAGTQFDPELADVFVKLVETGEILIDS